MAGGIPPLLVPTGELSKYILQLAYDPDDGRPWDFNVKTKKDKAMDLVLRREALLVIGSPIVRAKGID